VGGGCASVHGDHMVCAMIPRRERIALRADKWWASVWLIQMCMEQRGGPKPLTDRVVGGILYGLKRNVVSDGPTVDKEKT
jgi:hypothetical protein